MSRIGYQPRGQTLEYRGPSKHEGWESPMAETTACRPEATMKTVPDSNRPGNRLGGRDACSSQIA